LIFFIFIIACKNSVSKGKQTPIRNDSATLTKDSLPNPFDVMEELTSQFENKVKLDTFIYYITKQENVRLITQLNKEENYETNTSCYSGNGYSFESRIGTNQATTFVDGNHKLKFGNYSLTCSGDSIFECEDYSFNKSNSLVGPKIIEISGYQFLYSDVSYMCNGIGCGCNITFIYDLQTKRPTFLENYRVPYDGFFISDFDNDNNPDLLVISKKEGELTQKEGLRFDEFKIKLSWYSYDKGKFRPKKSKITGTPYSFELYSIVPDYNHSSHGDLVYSITKDDWNR